MTEEKPLQKEKPHSPQATKPQPKRLQFWHPIVAIALVVFIYFFSQLVAGVFVSIYPAIRGWGVDTTNLWLKTPAGQFWTIMFIEVSVVLMVWGLLKIRGLNLKAIGLKKPKWMDISYALAGFAAYFVLYVIIALIAQKLFPSIDFDQKQQIGFQTARETSQLILVFMSLVVAPPIAEEILCRGFLYTGLRSRWPVWIAAVVTSILFAAAHLQFGSGAPLLWVAAIDTFILSLVLVFLREKTNSLSAPIMLHMLKNGLAFTLLFVIGVR